MQLVLVLVYVFYHIMTTRRRRLDCDSFSHPLLITDSGQTKKASGGRRALGVTNTKYDHLNFSLLSRILHTSAVNYQ